MMNIESVDEMPAGTWHVIIHKSIIRVIFDSNDKTVTHERSPHVYVN